MNRQAMQLIGNNKKLGGMMLVLSFAAMACVAVAGPKSTQCVDQQPTEPGKPKCPPDSYTYTNNSSGAVDVSYSCEENHGGAITVPAGSSLTFDKNCDTGPGEEPGRMGCGLNRLGGPGRTLLFSAHMQIAYSNAYGIDLGAVGYTVTDSDLKLPRKIYDVDGHLIRLRYFAIPVIDKDGEFVEWEITTVEPNFSVKDGEVVIRDNRKRVIGDRTGITLEK